MGEARCASCFYVEAARVLAGSDLPLGSSASASEDILGLGGNTHFYFPFESYSRVLAFPGNLTTEGM